MLNIDQIIKRSYKNCHAMGLHSIVFDENEKGHLKRMFYTDKDHVLHKTFDVFAHDLSLSLHSHHCDIQMHVVKGTIHNITGSVKKDKSGNIDGWSYQSPIKTGKGSFIFSGRYDLFNINDNKLDDTNNNTCYMQAVQLHTVYVPAGHEAAWIISEGERDPNYNNICYSNDDLAKFKFEEHYLPISKEEVEVMLKYIK